jgi:hypothetical protein
MRRQATKTNLPAEPQIEQEKSPLTLVGFPAPPLTPCLDQAEKAVNKITVDYESAGYAEFERGSLLRVFRKQFRRHVEYLMSNGGGKLCLEDACKEASVRYDQKGAAALMEDLLNREFDSVSFNDLSRLWECSPEEAERYFELAKHESQRDFCSGHMAAEVFKSADWLGSVWLRAQFLAVRDSFIVEYKPDGGIEFALIDLLAMSFFMQNYWAELSVKRTRTSPRRETEEYRQWQGYGSDEAHRRRFDDGNWVVPWVSEEHALRTATEMFDHFTRLFQRTLRQLNSHRLAKLKAKKLQAEIRWLNRRAREARG